MPRGTSAVVARTPGPHYGTVLGVFPTGAPASIRYEWSMNMRKTRMGEEDSLHITTMNPERWACLKVSNSSRLPSWSGRGRAHSRYDWNTYTQFTFSCVQGSNLHVTFGEHAAVLCKPSTLHYGLAWRMQSVPCSTGSFNGRYMALHAKEGLRMIKFDLEMFPEACTMRCRWLQNDGVQVHWTWSPCEAPVPACQCAEVGTRPWIQRALC